MEQAKDNASNTHYDKESDDDLPSASKRLKPSPSPVKRVPASSVPVASGRASIMSFFGKKQEKTQQQKDQEKEKEEAKLKEKEKKEEEQKEKEKEKNSEEAPAKAKENAVEKPEDKKNESTPAVAPAVPAASAVSKASVSVPTNSLAFNRPQSARAKAADDEEIEEENQTNKQKQEEEEDEEEEEDDDAGALLLDDDSGASGDSSQFGQPGYRPDRESRWAKGAPVPYSAMAEMFALVEDEPKRLRIMAIVSDFFRAVIANTPADLLACVYLACNKIAPAYEGSELGIGDAILLKAIAEATGGTTAKLKLQLRDVGDLGTMACASRSRQQTMMAPPKLTCSGVFKNLKELAAMTGKNTGRKKADLIKRMLVACIGEEAKFIIRGLQGNLRIGLAEKGVISSLARAITLTPPVNAAQPQLIADTRTTYTKEQLEAALTLAATNVSQAYTEVPCHDKVVDALLQGPVSDLPTRCFLRPGIPVKVMLGKPCTGLEAILERFIDCMFTLEFKYDGERAQIHLLEDGSIHIYSRNSENHTGKYPDLIQRLPAAYDGDTVRSFIIDCEVVAWDSKDKKILPFQTLSTRKRKAVDEGEITVQVCLFAFDLIYLNGVSYLNQPFQARRQALWDHFKRVEGQFHFAEYEDTNDIEAIGAFLSKAIASSCEGLMVKALDKDAAYVPNKRNWLKVKKDYLAGVGDSLDLVPIAGWYGKGKRTGVYGGYLLACYDEETEEYQAITKIGTGLSDEALEEHANILNQHLIAEQPRYCRIPESIKPDVYFSPAVVWEVKCADLSISPIYPAAIGKVNADKGIALRFPRFLRMRQDKKPEDATSSDQVVDMYNNQSVVSNNKKNNKMEE